MILGQNLAAGTYPFVWDGGNSAVTFTASNWNFSGAGLSWVDELGTAWPISGASANSNNLFIGTLPAGNYNLIVSGTITGLDVTIRKVPA